MKIEYRSYINGKWVKTFHRDIQRTRTKDVINIYMEKLTSNEKSARDFHCDIECLKVANFFANDFHIPKII